MRWVSLLVLIAFFSGCGAASQDPSTPVPMVIPTEAAAATPEPIVPTTTPEVQAGPVPLTAEGLTSILIQDGDLPEGWVGDTLFEESPVDYDGPDPSVVLNQGLQEAGARFASGNVVLWVFDASDDAQAAFDSRADLITRTRDADAERLRPAIGDQTLLIPGKGDLFVTNSLLFVRCKAVVEIDLGNNTQVDWATNYATRLDQRLQPSVCA